MDVKATARGVGVVLDRLASCCSLLLSASAASGHRPVGQSPRDRKEAASAVECSLAGLQWCSLGCIELSSPHRLFIMLHLNAHVSVRSFVEICSFIYGFGCYK